MSAQLSVVLSTARTLVNDDLGTVFTDPVLIPKIQEAHRELQEQLWLAGSPIVRDQTSPIAVSASTKLLDFNTTPALPADLLCPISLYENVPGAIESSGAWTPMTEVFYIPLGTALSPNFTWWAWRKEQLLFAGGFGDRTIIIQYRKKILIPSTVNNEIGILFGEMYLSARAAALTAGTLGNKEVYDAMTALAKENLATVITANRGSQRPMMAV